MLSTCKDAKEAGVTCKDAREAGFTALKEAGFTCKDAREAGFKAGKECYEAGFTYEEGRAAGLPSHWRGTYKPFLCTYVLTNHSFDAHHDALPRTVGRPHCVVSGVIRRRAARPSYLYHANKFYEDNMYVTSSVECCNYFYYVVNVFSATVLIPALRGHPLEPLRAHCLGRPRRTLDL